MMLPYAFPHCRSGYCGYWFPNASAAHDDSWTMAIASVAFKSFPFSMPLYDGAVLQGYHFISAFIIHWISLIGIPLHTIFYGIIPFIWLILITKIILKLTKKISKDAVFRFIFVFLFFFGGSFSYILIIRHKLPFFYLNVMTGRQAIDYFQSMPLAVSLIPFLLSIYYLYTSNTRSLFKRVIYLIGIIFFAWGSKFYGGCAAASLLAIFELLEYIKTKNKQHFLFLGITIIVSIFSVILIYNPFSSGSSAGSTFIFSPFAIVHSFIEDKSLFYLPNLTLARYSLQAHGWGPRLFAIEIFTWTLYIIYTFGIRMIGLIYLSIKLFKRKISTAEIALTLSVLICLFGGTMFIQRVEWWNTAQFLDYPKIIMSLYTALAVAHILKKRNNKIYISLAVILIVVLSIHNSIQGFIERVSFRSALVIPYRQIEALKYLKTLPSGSVFTLPFDRYRITNSIEVNRNIDSVYIPVFSEKQMYYSTPYILELTSIDYSRRKRIVEMNLLRNTNHIDATYFYIDKSNNLLSKVKFNPLYFNNIFENDDVIILRRL